MFKIVFLFIALLMAAPGPVLESHYNDKTWHTLLNDVKMRYRFSIEHNSFVQVPRFGNDVKELDGKEVVLRGFFLPADVTGESYVLSYVPMQMCFFCAGSGIESVVELQTLVSHRVRFRRLNTDDFIEVRGRLKLNVNNLDHLIYVLEDAALVNVIK
jgi:hypothetical protein